MSIRSQFKTDTAAVAEGAWFDFSPNKDGSIPRVKLRRLSSVNPTYARLVKEAQARNEGRDLSEAEIDAQANALFVDAAIVDWENFQPEDDGDNVPFTRENALKIVNDPAWIDYVNDLRLKATRANGFIAKKIEATVKNS